MHPPNLLQICFVDVCTLNVEDENSKVGIVCSSELGWVGHCRRAIRDSMRKGKAVAEGRQVQGTQAESRHSHELGIPDSEFTVTLESKPHFRSH